MMRCLVTGAGGFIGGHLVDALVREGNDVSAVDVRPLRSWEHSNRGSTIMERCNLSTEEGVDRAFCNGGFDEVYNLAADMGGMGFIETHKLDCMRNALINLLMFDACEDYGVNRMFYASSACAYAEDKQTDVHSAALKESDAYPAMPEDGYGWEKLFSERLCFHYDQETNMECRSARYHNVYGPRTTWQGERAKAPAAICRKVAEAVLTGDHTIEIWGDGEQTRSFMYYTDCVKGTIDIMRSDVKEPLNLGSSELVTINQLVSIVEGIAGVELKRTYDLDAPKGVRGRNSDNSLILEKMRWEPSVTLLEGLTHTYEWVRGELEKL